MRTLAVAGYRSLRDVSVPLGRVTVVTGANGSGKSNLYRSARLLSEAAHGRLISSLAREGGLESVRWAGPEIISRAMRLGEAPVQGTSSRRSPVSVRLGFSDDESGFLLDLGLPISAPGGVQRFRWDPEIKREVVFSGPVMRPSGVLASRRNATVVSHDGRARTPVGSLRPQQSMVERFRGAESTPELAALQDRVAGWRFYDGFRTDADAPARHPQVATHTARLHDDGHDLAACIATIAESHPARRLADAVADAFDGASVDVDGDHQLVTVMRQPGLLRPLTAAELSDGTLRYLLLAAALLAVDPPTLVFLNEPESSLHPRLIPSLARLIMSAAEQAQIVVVTHSADLADALQHAGATAVELRKDCGETLVADQGLLSRPQWNWGSR